LLLRPNCGLGVSFRFFPDFAAAEKALWAYFGKRAGTSFIQKLADLLAFSY